jgi:hypothetical protein
MGLNLGTSHPISYSPMTVSETTLDTMQSLSFSVSSAIDTSSSLLVAPAGITSSSVSQDPSASGTGTSSTTSTSSSGVGRTVGVRSGMVIVGVICCCISLVIL